MKPVHDFSVVQCLMHDAHLSILRCAEENHTLHGRKEDITTTHLTTRHVRHYDMVSPSVCNLFPSPTSLKCRAM